LLPAIFIADFTGELDEVVLYDRWKEPLLLLYFSLSCVMG